MVATLCILAITAGWENISPMRTDVAPARVIWEAPLQQGMGFVIDKRGGAEGCVRFSDGGLTVEKTNDRGMIVVAAPRFPATTNRTLRFMADVHCDKGDYLYAQAGLRAYDAEECLETDRDLEMRDFYFGGAEEMRSTVNQAPGMYNRKYCHLTVRDVHGLVTPVIVVSGTPSRTVWRNWQAEDLEAADIKWKGYFEARTARDRSLERIDEKAFDRMLEADTVHTACLRKVNGVTRLIVDGEITYPVAYRGKGSFGKDALLETFAGGPVVREGVKLVVKGISMGGSDREPSARRYWTPRGFDAVGAVKDIKDTLRIVPDALCILSISCNAYPDFTRKEHPDEVWVKPDGSVVRGTSGSCVEGYDDMGVKDDYRWPWVSYASPSWRMAVKDNVIALVNELRRQRIDKRIVGVHFCGYHDAQFHAPYEDHSLVAKKAFADYLANDPLAVNDLGYFSKLLGFKAQEDFVRCFKRAIGKPAIAMRWNMGAFAGMPDLTSFAYSDAVDVIVPQPTYWTRRPGMASQMKLPYSTFDLHGKMYWNEFDLRTYAALETWAESGVVATKGLGQSDDFAMWGSVYHKLAGMMFANNSGYWFYDMGGGWFSSPEIARDIGRTVEACERILKKERSSSWRPDVALVVDEANMRYHTELPVDAQLGDVPYTEPEFAILRSQLVLMAASGVPKRFYLAEDVLRNPSLVEDCKTVVLAFFRTFDNRREALLRRLACDGRTLVFLSETAVGDGSDIVGFAPLWDDGEHPHVVVPEPGVSADEVRSLLTADRQRFVPGATVKAPRCTLKPSSAIRIMARFAEDGAIAMADRCDANCRRVYVCEPAGLTPILFNRLCRESGAYVPVGAAGLQVDMNGDFISCHALRGGHFDFTLPYACRVVNMKSGEREMPKGKSLALELTAGETCWFSIDSESVHRTDNVAITNKGERK